MTKTIKDKLMARGYDVEEIDFKALPKPKHVASINSYYIKASRMNSIGNINEFIFEITYNNGKTVLRASGKDNDTLDEAIDTLIRFSW